MDDSARKFIFPSMLATPSTSVFLYVLAVFSFVMGLSAMCLNIVTIPVQSIYNGLEYLLVICQNWLERVRSIAEKRTTSSPSPTQQDIESNTEGGLGSPGGGETPLQSIVVDPCRLTVTESNEAEQHRSI